MNKNMKQVKAAKAKAEEEALNRILYWVAGGSVLEFLLLLLNRYWCHYGPKTLQLRLMLDKVIPVAGVLALVAAAGGPGSGSGLCGRRKASPCPSSCA